MIRNTLLATCCALLCASPLALAGITSPSPAELTERVNTTLADPASSKTAQAAGHQRGVVCAYCHGEDGNSPKAIVPHLAGQNPEYLVHQFIAYANGTRKDYIMEGMMKDFTADDIVNLTVFYAVQKPSPPSSVPPGDMQRGHILYQGICQRCHGEDGRGGAGYPWIAAQNPAYVVRALDRYRDPSGKRTDAEMVAVTASLSDQNIEDLAAYLSSL